MSARPHGVSPPPSAGITRAEWALPDTSFKMQEFVSTLESSL
jgi:hypothetical protein